MEPNDTKMEALAPLLRMTNSLLARLVFANGDEIKAIVTQRKRKNPGDWIRGYNACDGTKGVTEIAKIVGVAQPTATIMLKSWEEKGIVCNIGTMKKTLYQKVLTLSD